MIRPWHHRAKTCVSIDTFGDKAPGPLLNMGNGQTSVKCKPALLIDLIDENLIIGVLKLKYGRCLSLIDLVLVLVNV